MFDPYHRWLAIPPGQRPPTLYQLLGIAPDEMDPEVIEEAALRQTRHVRTYQTGAFAEQCTAILNQIGQARATLMNPKTRMEYDAQLRPSAPRPVPVVLKERKKANSGVSWQVLWAVIGYMAILLGGAGLAFGLAMSRSRPAEPNQPAAPFHQVKAVQ